MPARIVAWCALGGDTHGVNTRRVLVAFAILGCAPAPPAQVAEPRASSVAPPPPLTVASTTPEPPPPRPAEPSPFVAQAVLAGGITGLHAVGKYLLVSQDYPVRQFGDRIGLALWKNGELELDAKYWDKLPQPGRVQFVIGDWPNVRAFTWWVGASSMYATLFRSSARGWVREARLEEHHLYRSVASARKRTVVLTGPAAPLQPGKVQLLELWAGGGLTPGPSLSRATPPCPAQIVPQQIVLAADERLFVFGRRCLPMPDANGIDEGVPMVEWFARGKKRGTLVELPVPDGNAGGYTDPIVIAEAPEGIELSFSGTGRRLFFDGSSFALRNETGPRLWELAQTPDGTQWGVTADNGVVSRKRGEAWKDVPLPRKPPACRERDCSMQIASIGDDVYLSVDDTLYQLHGPERAPLPRHELPSVSEQQ